MAQSCPDKIYTDQSRLIQILRNLVSNAIKFTREGSVEVIITDCPDTCQELKNLEQATIAFIVKDTGIGIPKDKLELIFKAFSQADGGINRQYGGTGLGLTISKKLSILLKGELNCKSEEGKGSTFTLILPVEAVSKEEIEQSTTSQTNPKMIQ